MSTTDTTGPAPGAAAPGPGTDGAGQNDGTGSTTTRSTTKPRRAAQPSRVSGRPAGETLSSPADGAATSGRPSSRAGRRAGRRREQSPFEILEASFWRLGRSCALSISGAGFADLPEGPMPLHQLRVRLYSPATSVRTRMLVWAYLVRQARTRGPHRAAWTVAAAALALPELTRIVTAQAPGFTGALTDLEAATLGAFLTELRRLDLANLADEKLRWRLLVAAHRAAVALRDIHAPTPASSTTSAAPAPAGPAMAASPCPAQHLEAGQ